MTATRGSAWRGRGAVIAVLAGVIATVVGSMDAASAPDASSAVRPDEGPAGGSSPAARNLHATAAIDVSGPRAQRAATPRRVGATAGCPYQTLRLRHAGETEDACVSATAATQNGSLHLYAVAPTGLSRWHAEIATAGGAIVSIRLIDDAGATWDCTGSACRGASLGAVDGQGRRTLDVADVGLRRRVIANADDDAAPSPRDVADRRRVSARLALPAPSQPLGIACAQPSLRWVDAEGGQDELCPSEGASIAWLDDGRRRYAFADAEGDELAITVLADGRVDTVSLGGLRCRGTACGGLVAAIDDGAHPMAPGDTPAARFLFSGLTLEETGRSNPPRRVTLSGELDLPLR